jgi:hypothetical protein
MGKPRDQMKKYWMTKNCLINLYFSRTDGILQTRKLNCFDSLKDTKKKETLKFSMAILGKLVTKSRPLVAAW